jgi:hypothetical protein
LNTLQWRKTHNFWLSGGFWAQGGWNLRLKTTPPKKIHWTTPSRGIIEVNNASETHAMATQYKVIALAVLFCAIALLYMVDQKALMPAQSISLSQVE